MRRPVGVILAAVLLGIVALFGILGAALALGVSIFSHNPVIPKLPEVRAVMIGTTTIELGFFLFCGWTVTGLFRLRRWARTAAIVIAGIVAFFSAMTGIGVLMAGKYAAMLPPGPAAGNVQTVLVGFAVFSFVVAAISLWWLTYFNLAGVRAAFAGLQELAAGAGATETTAALPEPGTPGWRIVIMIWAWLILISILYLPFLLWRGMPMFFFGAILRGWAGTTALLITWAIEIYMAIGLLRKWKPAWYVALIFQIYAIGYSATFMLPGVRARFFEYMQEVMTRSSEGLASPAAFLSTNFFGFCLGMGLILVLILIWALIQRREDYLGA